MTSSAPSSDVSVGLVESEVDIARLFGIAAEAFGNQAHDRVFSALNPRWDTPEGRAENASRWVDRWRKTTKDKDGNLNTMFLKATVPNDKGEQVIAGMAIWVQLSMVEGYGDKPVEDIRTAMDLEALHPGDPIEQRYCVQVDQSLHKRRIEVVKEKAIDGSQPPAVFALDMCSVDPGFQRRGIANKLVQWGLDETQKRGGIEAVLEASAMGRGAYAKLGFWQEGDEIVFNVDEEFKKRDNPSNIFMRSKRS